MITNIYAPFSLTVHLVICIIATLFYGFMFVKKKHSHYFTLILAFDLTLFTQMNISRGAFFALAITEAFLIVLIIISLVRVKRINKKLMNAEKSDKKTDFVDDAFNDNNV